MTSSLTSWVIPIKRALEAAGCDSEQILTEAGLDLRLLQDTNARYPLEQTSKLWQLAVNATQDPAFGLRVASEVTPTTFHALGYALGASSTLKEMFERLVRFVDLFTDAADLEFVLRNDEYHFYLHAPPSGPRPTLESTDAFISLFVRMCRSRLGKQFSPLRIYLRRPEPENTGIYNKVFRAPINYSADINAIILDRSSAEMKLLDGNPELARLNDEIIIRSLARTQKENITMRVRAVLMNALPSGNISEEIVAESLNLSCRNLQRKFSERNTSYREILDETRKDLAISYLQNKNLSINEITYQLGFSDSRSFGRAFKRWTGVSPSVYRDQSQCL